VNRRVAAEASLTSAPSVAVTRTSNAPPVAGGFHANDHVVPVLPGASTVAAWPCQFPHVPPLRHQSPVAVSLIATSMPPMPPSSVAVPLTTTGESGGRCPSTVGAEIAVSGASFPGVGLGAGDGLADADGNGPEVGSTGSDAAFSKKAAS
jgi:hypothetical protein